jgi:chromosome segregation ATPase
LFSYFVVLFDRVMYTTILTAFLCRCSRRQKIQDLQSQFQALQEENYSSHHTSTQLQSQIDRTLAALQIASTASANARSEADAAEAKVDSLSRQMEEFHSLVEELRRGMDLVRGEHDEVSTIARSVESRLIQVESKLGRATKVTIEAKEERDELKNRAEGAEHKTRLLNEKIDDYEHDIRCLKKGVIEMEELEKIRSERTNRIENELHVTRETLLDATSAAAEAESTVTSLNSVIEELRKENELLHNQISESRDTIHRDRSKQNEALTAVEKEVQKWKLKCEEVQEANRTLKVDKNTAEKQLEQMKSRMANMERRMNDIPRTSSAVTPITSSLGLINCFGAKEISVDSEPRKQLTYVSQLPMRQTSKRSQYDGASRELNYASRSKNFSSSEENNSNDSSNHSRSSSHNTPSFSKRKVTKSNKCCICQQDATGMMKNCQCDNINCDKRAHITCIAKKNEDKCISVSAILCD